MIGGDNSKPRAALRSGRVVCCLLGGHGTIGQRMALADMNRLNYRPVETKICESGLGRNGVTRASVPAGELIETWEDVLCRSQVSMRKN
jgi:hypothetical protein